MSEKGREGETPRRSSQRTQRYNPISKEIDHSKRKTLGLIGGGLVALVAVGLGLRKLSSTPGSTPEITQPKPSLTPRIEITPTPIPAEIIPYRNKLLALNDEILRNPGNIKEIAAKVSDLGITYFCNEFGYNPQRYEGKVRYFYHDEYQRDREESSGCIITQNYEDEYARTYVDDDYMAINLDKILYGNNLQARRLEQYPALVLFTTVIHELHHATAPVLADPDSDNPEDKLRGLGQLKTNSEYAKPGYICYNAIRMALEETVVENSVDMMVFKKFGFRVELPDENKIYNQRYQVGVIDRFFNGDHKPLINHQQKTQPVEFFALVGSKYGAQPDKAAEVGEEYLKNLLLGGIFT